MATRIAIRSAGKAGSRRREDARAGTRAFGCRTGGRNVGRQWITNGHPFVAASLNQPGAWNAYRVICKGANFEIFRNQVSSTYEIQVGHLPPSGKLSLVLSAGAPSDIEFRNIRVRESQANVTAR